VGARQDGRGVIQDVRARPRCRPRDPHRLAHRDPREDVWRNPSAVRCRVPGLAGRQRGSGTSGRRPARGCSRSGPARWRRPSWPARAAGGPKTDRSSNPPEHSSSDRLSIAARSARPFGARRMRSRPSRTRFRRYRGQCGAACSSRLCHCGQPSPSRALRICPSFYRRTGLTSPSAMAIAVPIVGARERSGGCPPRRGKASEAPPASRMRESGGGGPGRAAGRPRCTDRPVVHVLGHTRRRPQSSGAGRPRSSGRPPPRNPDPAGTRPA